MTANLIAYWRNMDQRAINQMQIDLGYAQLAETTRHNVATEGNQAKQIALGYAQLAETNRHNVAQEGIAQSTQLETVRHNQVIEGLEGRDLDIKQANAAINEGKLELETQKFKTTTIIDTTLEGASTVIDSVKTLAGLFGFSKK